MKEEFKEGENMYNIIDGVKKYSKTDRLAVICGEEKISYSQVEKCSNILGNIMLEKYKTDTPVIILGNKDIMILVAMIGALKSGKAYVPIDTSSPIQRVKDIIETVNPEVIFDLSENAIDIHEILSDMNILSSVEIIDKDIFMDFLKLQEYEKFNTEIDSSHWVKDDENSYILFTSGTTGKPKGVQISTYNLDSFIGWMAPILDIDGSEIVVMDQPSYSFDLSVSSLYPGITLGATLYSIPSNLVLDFKKLYEELGKSNIKVWVSTPSFANMCLNDEIFDEKLLPEMRSMLFIGEVLPVAVAKSLMERFPRARIINGYGPTEATVGISHVFIDKDHIESNKSLPVGVPMPNCKVKIVDENMKEVPNGEKGEIVIVGPSVSKGYYKNLENTKKSFYIEDGNCFKDYPSPISELDKVLRLRAYKTGDLGAIEDDGNIKFFGRKDFQIKLNGYRIEIEDIENNLRKIHGVSSAVVLPVKKDNEVVYLKAILVLENGLDTSKLQKTVKIKKELSSLIPKYMVPRSFDFIDEIPLNTNGKIDRKKLYRDMVEEV